jgi:hypothetical protein
MTADTHKDLAIILFTIILVGLFGNLMNLKVLTNKEIRKVSTFRFLLYLSVIDIMVLIICAIDSALTYGFDIEVRLMSSAICKIHTFFTYFLTHMSSIVLMCVSIERLSVVYNKINHSFRSNRNLNFKSNRIEKILLIITVILVLFNIHYLFFFDLTDLTQLKENPSNQNDDFSLDYKHRYLSSSLKSQIIDFIMNKKLSLDKNMTIILTNKFTSNYKYIDEEDDDSEFKQYVCYSFGNEMYDFFITRIWIWVDSTIYSFMPIFVMIICSFTILVKIRRKRSNFLKLTFSTNRRIIENRINRNKQILYMLTATNIYFIICSLPYCILCLKLNFTEYSSKFTQTLFIVHILSYSNNSFSFVFYGLFSKQYRDSAALLFKKNNRL